MSQQRVIDDKLGVESQRPQWGQEEPFLRLVMGADVVGNKAAKSWYYHAIIV